MVTSNHRRPGARRADRGITLVEVMVAGAVLAIVLGGAMLVLMGINQSSDLVRRVGDTQTAARQALDMLEIELRAAGGGASRGHVGLAPASGPIQRVPIIYTEPGPVVTTPGPGWPGAANGAKIATSSIFIITTEPSTAGVTAASDGMVGTVQSVLPKQPIDVLCTNFAGAHKQCDDTSFGDRAIVLKNADGTFAPLLVSDDFHWAVLITPTSVTPNGDLTRIVFSERDAPSFTPSAKAPFGFGFGAHLLRARVTHWYIWPSDDGTHYDLRRSRPVLRGTAFSSTVCNPAESPFEDETNKAGGVAGVVLSSGPIESLQASFIIGNADGSDVPIQWTAALPFTACDGPPPLALTSNAERLREVRVAVVGRSPTPDPTQLSGPSGKTTALKYTVQPFEGSICQATATAPWPVATTTKIPVLKATTVSCQPTSALLGAALAPTADAFPRRTFAGTVITRNALGFFP